MYKKHKCTNYKDKTMAQTPARESLINDLAELLYSQGNTLSSDSEQVRHFLYIIASNCG